MMLPVWLLMGVLYEQLIFSDVPMFGWSSAELMRGFSHPIFQHDFRGEDVVFTPELVNRVFRIPFYGLYNLGDSIYLEGNLLIDFLY